MPMTISRVVDSRAGRWGRACDVRDVALDERCEHATPVARVHHFRLRGSPLGLRPDTGSSVVSYVFEDSPGRLRLRDSLANDFVVDPGGLVWAQAGRGLFQQALATDARRDVHLVQFVVNLGPRYGRAAPKVLHLAAHQVPEWRSGAGDRVRVALGSFREVASPLLLAEPFTLLDVHVRCEVVFTLPDRHSALVYVLLGSVFIRAEGCREMVVGEQAVAMQGDGGPIAIEAAHPAHLLVLSASATLGSW